MSLCVPGDPDHLRRSVYGCLAIAFLFSAAIVSHGQTVMPASVAPVPQPVATVEPGAKPAGQVASSSDKIKVVFDEKQPGVVFIESNGERIRVDTGKKTVDPADVVPGGGEPDKSNSSTLAAKQSPKADDPEESPYDFERGDEPYDYRVVNVPTPKNVPKGTWNMVFTHRFTQPIHPVSTSGPNLFGLDSYGIASFGISYGITDKLYVSAYRSPLCQKGLCQTIELGVGYNWLSHDKKSPFALTTYASMEGNENFTEEYTFNLQARLSARVGKRVYLFFSPAIHLNANGQGRFDPRATDYFPPATVANSYHLPTHGASYGFGASVLITPTIVALFDFVPRTGFKLGQVRPIFDSNFRVTGFTNESHPSMGFGIQKNIGKHAFAITFSNTQATTTARYNSSNLTLKPHDVVIGFNLSRRF